MSNKIVIEEKIIRKIFLLRNYKVMLDKDLAGLYGVKPIRLREQVKRNKKRFPADFMFQLNNAEVNFLVSQNAIPSKKVLGGYNPYVFTEQGVAMLSSVLNSDRAIEVNILIMRTFTKLREMMVTHKDLKQKVEALERKYREHDQKFQLVFEAIKKMLELKIDNKKKLPIGFHAK
ncbi:MAG: ORF6N domain-containing protein [Candidatus Omnitrophica bacterium]|nr:ORF6N domain-containing protein [Candidatus Omnitrophota bacterium]